jgi:hypothetical protein
MRRDYKSLIFDIKLALWFTQDSLNIDLTNIRCKYSRKPAEHIAAIYSFPQTFGDFTYKLSHPLLLSFLGHLYLSCVTNGTSRTLR